MEAKSSLHEAVIEAPGHVNRLKSDGVEGSA